MKTIHERAHDAVGHLIHKGGMQTPDKLLFKEQMFINGHIKGATEQKEIDIKKACKWLMNYFVIEHDGMSPSGCDVFLQKFRKAMEE